MDVVFQHRLYESPVQFQSCVIAAHFHYQPSIREIAGYGIVRPPIDIPYVEFPECHSRKASCTFPSVFHAEIVRQVVECDRNGFQGLLADRQFLLQRNRYLQCLPIQDHEVFFAQVQQCLYLRCVDRLMLIHHEFFPENLFEEILELLQVLILQCSIRTDEDRRILVSCLDLHRKISNLQSFVVSRCPLRLYGFFQDDLVYRSFVLESSRDGRLEGQRLIFRDLHRRSGNSGVLPDQLHQEIPYLVQIRSIDDRIHSLLHLVRQQSDGRIHLGHRISFRDLPHRSIRACRYCDCRLLSVFSSGEVSSDPFHERFFCHSLSNGVMDFYCRK